MEKSETLGKAAPKPSENQFLGQAKIGKLLLKFSIPCILALLITSLYNIVDQILGLFGASSDNLVYARQYFFIILSFFPIYMLGYMLNSVIRADGSPAFAMAATVIGAVTNIILDPIFSASSSTPRSLIA